jgi:hypothetical protein
MGGPLLKVIQHKCDHSAIYLLITGSYTPGVSQKRTFSTPNPTHKRGGEFPGALRECGWIGNLKSPDAQG